MVFDLLTHLESSFLSHELPRKKNYASYMNLSSNELQHPHLSKLLQQYHATTAADYYNKYPFYEDYRARISGYFQIKPSEISFSAGSDQAISYILNYFTKNQKRLILQSPNYYNYKNYAFLNNLQVEELNYLALDEAHYVDIFCKYLAEAAPSLVILTNPNGITGTILSLLNIEAILSTAYDNNHLVVLDLTYASFSNLDHLYLINKYSNLFILHSLSKSFGAAGFRIGFILANQKLVGCLQQTGIEYCVNSHALSYVGFILDNKHAYDSIIEDIIQTREYSIRFLKENCNLWQVIESHANFITVDTKSKGAVEQVITGFMQEQIYIKGMGLLVPELSTYIRLTVIDSMMMQKVLQLLLKVYRSIYSEAG